MKIIVTGGLGFIGKYVADRYKELGHTVLVVDKDLRKDTGGHSVRYLDCSRHEFHEVVDEFKPELISHHAAECSVKNSLENPLGNVMDNLYGVVNVLEACRRYKVRKLVFASSMGAIAEDGMPKSPYGYNKACAEWYVNHYVLHHGLRACVLRYGNVYGSGCHGVVKEFFDRVVVELPMTINGDGLQERDYIFIDDVIEANVDALEMEGMKHIGTGVLTSVLELAKKVAMVAGKAFHVEHISELSGEVRKTCCRSDLVRYVPLSTGLVKYFN